jgi:hypothetical protein
MSFAQPKKWSYWLPLVEWWYNTNFHTSLKMSPFQALYGFPPPMVSEMFLVDEQSEDPATMIHNRQQANQVIRENLLQAQERMKFFADQNMKERELAVGDMVYLKAEPYRHTSLSLHHCIKLHSKFYGPF